MDIKILKKYEALGFKLMRVAPQSKLPIDKCYNEKDRDVRPQDFEEGQNVAILHAFSGTCSLDIDDLELSLEYFRNSPFDLSEALANPSNVKIVSGVENRAKILYRVETPLPTKKVKVGGKLAFELRCSAGAGKSVYDLLPPSIHPVTLQPYQWRGDFGNLSTIPQSLLTLWQSSRKIEKLTVLPYKEDIANKEKFFASVIECIPPDCPRDEWINVGMSLHYEGLTYGEATTFFHIWDKWSSKAKKKYPGVHELIQQWKSFKTDFGEVLPITFKSTEAIAKKYGWCEKEVASLFFNLEEEIAEETFNKSSIPNLDLSIFPRVLSERALEVSESVGCDPLVPLFSGLACVCAVANAQSKLRLTNGFVVPPILWIMSVGEPADKKTPGSKPMLHVLNKLQYEDREPFKLRQLQYEGEEAFYASVKKQYLEHCADLTKLGNDAPPAVPEIPKQPQPLRLQVSDVTSQKLVRMCADRPEGVLCYLDEMAGWIKKITDNNSGEDRSAWVQAYEASYYEMDRVGGGSFFCDNLAVSFYGNIQPRILSENLQKLSTDGLIQRFIPVPLRPSKTKLGTPISPLLSIESEWEDVVRAIYALPKTEYVLSKDAYDSFRDFQRFYEELKKEERLVCSPDIYMTAFGKLEGLVGRVCLIFHLIENGHSEIVTKLVMDRAIIFVKNYVLKSLRYTFCELAGANSLLKSLESYIIMNADKLEVTLAELQLHFRKEYTHVSNHSLVNMIIVGMHHFEEMKWVARADNQKNERLYVGSWFINKNLKIKYEEKRELIKSILKKRKSA